jgi:hypothetical protein
VGFEDCSASSAALPADPTATEHVEQQAPGTWAFFNFSVGAAATVDRYVAATVTATADTTSECQGEGGQGVGQSGEVLLCA